VPALYAAAVERLGRRGAPSGGGREGGGAAAAAALRFLPLQGEVVGWFRRGPVGERVALMCFESGEGPGVVYLDVISLQI